MPVRWFFGVASAPISPAFQGGWPDSFRKFTEDTGYVGDDVTLVFTGKSLDNTPIVPTSVVVTQLSPLTPAAILVDDGVGGLFQPGFPAVPTGTIDYATGALDLNYPVGKAPDTGEITALYRIPFVPLRHTLHDAKGKPGEALSDADSTDYDGFLTGLWKQFVSEPLQAGTIVTADFVTCFLQARSADSGAASAMWAGIVSNDGSMLRGEILARSHYGTNDVAAKFDAVNENRQFASNEVAQNSITVQAGDRLVVEIGFTEIND